MSKYRTDLYGTILYGGYCTPSDQHKYTERNMNIVKVIVTLNKINITLHPTYREEKSVTQVTKHVQKSNFATKSGNQV
jgi:hypothetical protein